MIRVTITLHSARTGKVSELGRMEIANDGTGSHTHAHYDGAVLRRPNYRSATRIGRVLRHARNTKTIWHLLAKMLDSMGYA